MESPKEALESPQMKPDENSEPDFPLMPLSASSWLLPLQQGRNVSPLSLVGRGTVVSVRYVCHDYELQSMGKNGRQRKRFLKSLGLPVV
jgi:hypothetical protein